jgi:oxygen-dependent protoporphyrinogen oxidase
VGVKFPNRAAEGINLARCFLSGEEAPDIAAIHRELQDISGVRGEPRFHRVFRWSRSMAQYSVGHASRVAEIQELVAGIPGLHLAGNAYAGIGLPDCVRSGKQAAARIAGS